MKSTQRMPKPPKQSKPKADSTLIANEQKDQFPVEEQVETNPVSNKPENSPKVESQVKIDSKQKKLDLPLVNKQERVFEERPEQPELPPEHCQHIRVLDCDKPVSRIFYECYHCLQGLVSECTGEPALEEFKGRLQVQPIKVQCPNCERTAIRLSTGKVLSTTLIPSPWGMTSRKKSI